MRQVKRMFSRPVRLPWNPPEKPMGQETRLVRLTRPLSGDSAPHITRMSVDLPAPFRPRMPMFTPSRKMWDTLSSTTLRPCGRP